MTNKDNVLLQIKKIKKNLYTKKAQSKDWAFLKTSTSETKMLF